MSLANFLSDVYASVIPRDVVAESPKPDVNDGIKTGTETGSSGTAQQQGDAGVRGGVSTKTPATGKASRESKEEAEVNRQDAKKGSSSSSSSSGSGGGGNSGGKQGGGGGVESKLKECIKSDQCVPAKDKYNDCVTQGKGDCTEELFNLAQRISKCAGN